MTNLWKAHDDISRLAMELATVISAHSLSFDDANALFTHAFQMARVHVNLKVTSPAFKARAAEQRLANARQEIADRNIRLIEQLGEFGIDHLPVFADRQPDSDLGRPTMLEAFEQPGKKSDG